MIWTPPREWINGRPPRDWKRVMACDVGGATHWAFEIAAQDPWGNVVFYDELSAIAEMDWLAEKLKPKLLDEHGEPYYWIAKVIDYENKLAAEDFRRRGVIFTNAQKMGKASSINRLSAYLSTNPKHHFPEWHPRAGQPNAPRLYVTSGCPVLIHEIPQQRWKEEVGSDGRLKNEADRSVRHDCWDACIYIVRELPDPATLPAIPAPDARHPLSKQSECYYEMVRMKEREAVASGKNRRVIASV